MHLTINLPLDAEQEIKERMLRAATDISSVYDSLPDYVKEVLKSTIIDYSTLGEVKDISVVITIDPEKYTKESVAFIKNSEKFYLRYVEETRRRTLVKFFEQLAFELYQRTKSFFK